ncbi:MAG: peptide deformylase [Candidatus Omnitrophica bacterium]|nr:peptide deformylase [Candidatus Omnitrophota bacterium]
MAVRKILSILEANELLSTKSAAIRLDDPQLDEIITDLKDTLLVTPNGVGLAAVQIGYFKRVFVLNGDYVEKDLDKSSIFKGSKNKIITFINPKVISGKGTVREEEGCLSVPGSYVSVERQKLVKVKAFNEAKEQFYERFSGLAARAIQQEIDHLNGILIIDYIRKKEAAK